MFKSSCSSTNPKSTNNSGGVNILKKSKSTGVEKYEAASSGTTSKLLNNNIPRFIGDSNSNNDSSVNKMGSKSARYKDMKIPIDKTKCSHCGSSASLKSDFEQIQEVLKEKECEISSYKSQLEDFEKLKEEFKSLEKSYKHEISEDVEEKKTAVTIRCSTVENEAESMKRSMRELYSKNVDWIQKYAIASEDIKQQEEVIAQLRDRLTEREELESVNSSLKKKYSSLEMNFQSVFSELRNLRETNKRLTDENSKIRRASTNVKSNQSIISKVQSTTQTDAHASESTIRSNDKNSNSNDGQTQNQEMQKSVQDLTMKCSKYQDKLKVVNEKNKMLEENLKLAKEKGGIVEPEDESKKQNSILAGKLKSFKEEHSNCNELHDFLRETIEKLRNDNVHLCEEINGLKVQSEQNKLNSENLQATLNEMQAEKERILNSYKELEGKYRTLIEKSIALRKSHDPNMIENLQKAIISLQKQCQSMKDEMEKMTEEVEKKMSEAQRELAIEKERADSCLAQSLAEREKLEKRWQERWSRHQASLVEQLETLRTNHQGSLQSAAEREEALAKELKSFQGQYEKSKDAWEKYKKRLTVQVQEWKDKYEELTKDFDDTRKNKIHVELMFQEKTNELETLHEIVRQECEERLELKKKVEEMEHNIEKLTETDSCQELFKTPLTPLGQVSKPNMMMAENPPSRTHSNEYINHYHKRKYQLQQQEAHSDVGNFNDDVQTNKTRPESASPSIIIHKTPFYISKALEEMNDQSQNQYSSKLNPNEYSNYSKYSKPTDAKSIYQNQRLQQVLQHEQQQQANHLSPLQKLQQLQMAHQNQQQQQQQQNEDYLDSPTSTIQSGQSQPRSIRLTGDKIPFQSMQVPLPPLHMSMMRGKPGMGALIPGPGRQQQKPPKPKAKQLKQLKNVMQIKQAMPEQLHEKQHQESINQQMNNVPIISSTMERPNISKPVQMGFQIQQAPDRSTRRLKNNNFSHANIFPVTPVQSPNSMMKMLHLKNSSASTPVLQSELQNHSVYHPGSDSKTELGKIRGSIDTVVYTVGPGRQRLKKKKEPSLLPHERLLREYPGIAKYKRNFANIPINPSTQGITAKASKRFNSNAIIKNESRHSRRGVAPFQERAKISVSDPPILPSRFHDHLSYKGNGDYNY